MVMNADTQEAESAEKEPLVLISNLLWVAIHNISYNRGLFNENCFRDKSVPELGMKVKKLMPMDVESRRLIDWMENGVYDALQKRYLKTLLFCICEEEEGPMIEKYAFSFSYTNTGTEEVAMNMSCAGIKMGSTTFTSNASEVTPDQMRSSACKMIRMLVSLMKTLDPMPEERTILMKLLYYDDVTPEDYEPPFFNCCANNEAIDVWNKNTLKKEVGNANRKHLVLAVKVKSVHGPYDDNNVNSGDDGMSVDDESDQDDFSETEVRPFEVDHYIVPPNDDTQDVSRGEERRAQVKDWICSRDIGTVNASDTDDPKAPHTKEDIVQNISPTEITKHNNDDLIYMKAINTNANNDKFEIKDMEGAVGCILCTNPTAKNYWNLDSGASNHIGGKNKWFTNLRPIPKDKKAVFLNAAKRKVQLSEMGDIMSEKIRLYDVYLSNDLEDNELYVSIGQLTGEGYVVMINKGEVTIRLARNFNHIVGNGSLDRDTMAYILKFFNGSVLERDQDHSSENQGGGGAYEMAEGEWVLDSGCHTHITRKKTFLKEKRRLRKKKKLNLAGYGSLTSRFKGNVEKDGMRLKDVYLCQGSSRNLISVSQLDVLGYNFLFSGNHCEIKYKDEEDTVGVAHVDGGNLNYYVEFLHSKD